MPTETEGKPKPLNVPLMGQEIIAEPAKSSDGRTLSNGYGTRPSLKSWLSLHRAAVSKRLGWGLAALLVIVGTSVVIWRASNGGTKGQPILASSPTVVPVTRVERQDLYNEVTIPAEFRPYVEVELHAKVAGYVQEIKVDFGDRVKAGQLLATLDVPELNDELHRAVSAQNKAQADYTNAHQIYNRLLAVQKQNPLLVALQELDTAAAKDHAAEAAIAEAKAEVEKYQTMVGYTRITAPFDGVITHRYVDPGALVQAGTTSETQSLPVVRVSDNYHLRLDFPVSVQHVKDVHVGDTVEVRVASLTGKKLKGTITRTTQRVNEQTRTMMTEIEVPNPDLEVVPGMYADASIRVDKRPKALALSTEAVPPDRGGTVFVVNREQQIEQRAVTLGIETPTQYEVTSGLNEGDLIVIGKHTEIKPGQRVEPKLIGSLAKQ